jgi:FkbM family methyltransferase
MSLVARVADVMGRESILVRALRPLYAGFLRVRYRSGGMPWALNGTPVRIDPSCREEMGQVYDSTVVEWLRPKVQEGQVIWNIGANVGAYALQAARWVGPSGHVLAIEPNPNARALLERHLQWSGVHDWVTVLESAVGERPGRATLYLDGASPMSAIGRPNPVIASRAVAVTVPVTTLDALLAAGHPRPDWLIIDVEGYEMHVLAGGAAGLRALGSRLGVICELHPDVWPSLDQTPSDLDRFLTQLGRRIVPLRGDADSHAGHGIVALVPTAEPHLAE